MDVIARKTEQGLLAECYADKQPHFVVVYGRRRVGKTFLVREFFEDRFCFRFTGLANTGKTDQLREFNVALQQYGQRLSPVPDNWFDAFGQLRALIEQSKDAGKKVVFLDEMPWIDTHKSKFLPAFEHFWNGWGSGRADLLLIVCGSATAWITNKLFRNRGGLYNRVTRQICLRPFTLHECEAYFRSRGIVLSQHQILECYMIFGGIPYYLNLFRKEKSFSQNVDILCFGKNAALAGEYEVLYASLFEKPEGYVDVIETLARKPSGHTRPEIVAGTKLTSGGGLAKILAELEQCGLIRKYQSYGKKNRGALYQLMDFFTLFHMKYLRDGKISDEHYWTNSIETGERNAWAGYAFERVCLHHLDQIKQKLSIAGVLTHACAWRSSETSPGAQIDLVIERRDGVINLCEIKFSKIEYAVTKEYDAKLRGRKEAFRRETRTRKALHTTFITTYGLARNAYWNDVQSEVTMEDLFDG
ncbi:MAG: AAA family ATPase [Clostridiales Family XIII bacterium]|jgi:hypothetical protein|nr:AAA family ATPase [Clostridiales Family XIII bacterium]